MSNINYEREFHHIKRNAFEDALNDIMIYPDNYAIIKGGGVGRVQPRITPILFNRDIDNVKDYSAWYIFDALKFMIENEPYGDMIKTLVIDAPFGWGYVSWFRYFTHDRKEFADVDVINRAINVPNRPGALFINTSYVYEYIPDYGIRLLDSTTDPDLIQTNYTKRTDWAVLFELDRKLLNNTFMITLTITLPTYGKQEYVFDTKKRIWHEHYCGTGLLP